MGVKRNRKSEWGSEWPSISLSNHLGFPVDNLVNFVPAFSVFIETVNRLHQLGFRQLSLELGSDYGANWGANCHCPLAIFRCRDQVVEKLCIHDNLFFIDRSGILDYVSEASVRHIEKHLINTLNLQGFKLKAQR